ncbi:hypothetical protein TrLO_g4863 [Triparma laevis f. longispina]|uniref:Uncharacterized protein n=1 Tax=Triparma laevis f. longispina TaxID=1714387 RepID=A0A9W7A2R6_9STRA|nr:hypothetical protein TrLO_g4863 [Triparma laevis f. longispina]
MTLVKISMTAFLDCSGLDIVDLLHANLQEFGDAAFYGCSELKSMTIPDSLQTIGDYVFFKCSELFLSNINVDDGSIDTTSEVVAHLRSKQQQQQ